MFWDASPVDRTFVSVAHGALVLTVLVAAYTDWRRRIIPNWLTLPAMGIGLLLGGLAGASSGFLDSLLGLFACGAIPYWVFRQGGMGGGDLKLFAAIGALAGLQLGLTIELVSLLVAMVVTLGRMAWEGRLLRVLGNSFFITFNAVLPRKWRREVSLEERGATRLGLSIAVATLLVVLDHYQMGVL